MEAAPRLSCRYDQLITECEHRKDKKGLPLTVSSVLANEVSVEFVVNVDFCIIHPVDLQRIVQG